MRPRRCQRLGIVLPQVAKPFAACAPAVRTANLVFTAGQLPIQAGHLVRTGKVGAAISDQDGKALARFWALNAWAAMHSLVGIDSVRRVVKVVGWFVASAPGFVE
jgi:enamine deaminase RidA (YjgF/YER057c/UK114 family)